MRYFNNAAQSFGRSAVRAGATRAVAATLSPGLGLGGSLAGLSPMPKMPAPPSSLVLGLAIATAGAYAYKYLVQGAPPGSVPGAGFVTVPGHRVTRSKSQTNPYWPFNAVTTSYGATVNLYHNHSQWQYWWGDLISENPPLYQRYWKTKYWPPNTQITMEKTGVIDLGTPASDLPGSDPLPIFNGPPIRLPGTITPPKVITQPDVIIEPNRQGGIVGPTTITTLITNNGRLQLSVTPAYTTFGGGREAKSAADTKFHEFANAFFGAGGEVIDFVRCLLFGLGFTYNSRSGVRTIPKSQWPEAFAQLVGWDQSNNRIEVGNYSKLDEYAGYVRKPPYRSQATNVLNRMEDITTCMFKNWLEDMVVGLQGQMKRDIARAGGFNIGPLGLDSQLAILNGDVPFERLFSL